MLLEGWLILAASLALLAAVAVQMVWLLRGSGPWWASVWLARLAAVALLAATLLVTALGRRGGLAPEPALVLLGLACAVAGVATFLTWCCGVDGAGPASDLLALALLLGADLAWRLGATFPACGQHTAWFWVSWLGLLVGVGGLVVGMAAALMMAVRLAAGRFGWRLFLPPGVEAHAFLIRATVLALVSLGAGLIIAAWWTWRWSGSLGVGEPGGLWLVASWLLAAVSLLSWQLGRRPGRWAALFVVAAAALGLLGLLVGPLLAPVWAA